VKANAPTRLKEFVDHLPNANEVSPYDMRLINFLLNAGFIAKAEQNVDSLEAQRHDHGRLKVDFYKTMRDTEFRDVDKIKAAYHKVVEDAAKSNFINNDFGLLEQTLGFEHLAMIASRGGPEIALQVSRVMPPELGTRFGAGKPGNALSKCLVGLLMQKEYELAVKVGKFATPEEREETQLGISYMGLTGGDWAREIDPSVWASLQEFAPNDLTVINGATQNAIDQKNKASALELARHQMLRNRRSSNGSMFAKAGWAEEYLAVAKEVHDLKADDPFYKDHRELKTLKMVLAMDFKNAEEAITFSEKHLSQPKYKAQFILELAKDWASPTCCGKASR